MFLAIELVMGVSLSRLLKEAQQNQEPFAERTVAFICSQLCAGLVAAHTLTAPDGSALGLVHRDLTPANVLISFEGVVKIIDFGIAKAEERISHTRTGQLKGKPAYMAPEQQRGGVVDHRADLFAFGVLMFEMLAGRRPWTARGAFDVMMEISNDPHPDLGELRKGLNPEFVAICHKCLEKKPDDRFNTAAEIKERLDAWLHAKGFTADDHHSLAQFILRNSQPQVTWWQEALRGEHAKKKAPTFKELEERIDEERERKSRAARKAVAPPPRPAAGTLTVKREAPAIPKGTMPMSAYRGPGSSPTPESSSPPSSGPVSSGQQLPPSSGKPVTASKTPSLMGLTPSALIPANHVGGSGQYAAQQLAPVPSSNFGSGQYAAQQAPASSPNPAIGTGTEFMAISPFAAQPVLAGQAPHALLAPTQEQVAPSLPPTVKQGPYAQSGPAPTLDHTFNDPGTMPMGPSMLLPSMTQPLPPGALAGLVPQTPYGAPDRVSQASPSIPPLPSIGGVAARRSRVPLVLGLVVVLLGGAGAGLWFFGDRVGVNVSEWVGGASSKLR
jgi:serine/threonine protein kinase